jgi:DNA-binding MarR family transcriptional regulator
MAMISRDRRPDARDFHQLASTRLDTLARQSRRYADADYRRKLGLSFLQCRIIGIVGSQNALAFRELCVGTDIEKGYASRLVTGLVDQGILRRSNASSDPRSFLVALTAAGRRLYNRIYHIAVQRNDTWLAVLSPEQRQTFFDCIDRLARESKKLVVKSRQGAEQPRVASRSRRTRPAGTSRDIKNATPKSKRKAGRNASL